MTWASTFQFWEPEGLPEIFLRQQPWNYLKSVEETLVCDHSIKAVLSRGTVYYAVQGGSNLQISG